MSKISPSELEERLSSDDPPSVLDIRPSDAYERGSIDGSHNVPVYDDLRRGDEAALRDSLSEIPDDRPVVTVCKAGVVATKATDLLESEGYDALTLAGGIRRWTGYRNQSLGYRLSSFLRQLV
ncbi:rhodanese-like domain-containing protein [Natronorubrum daqingense]|uniref:Rhodanese-related sulfurtransferase n=1 Tax=Natronorubrum daqingense TaxID=588898 RepID=A0A1N6ZYY8_9EURY|nr:rhodanese-like domain-containing protein [Natronorubrum daqingense]APX95197.1 thiosulfate sulfurtransferase [Natronorubrum daqingense]SIR32067.1 Rhodanese-related sulfurtransferase [Natronorubrum daqingense]